MVEEIHAAFPYLDNAIFEPSKMKTVSASSNTRYSPDIQRNPISRQN